VSADTLRVPARAVRPATPAPALAAPAVTDSSAGRLGAAATDSVSAASPRDSAAGAAADTVGTAAVAAPVVIDTARARARRDSVRRYLTAAAAARARADSTVRRESPVTVRRAPRSDPQDLMDLSDSLSNRPDAAPEPPSLPQPNAGP
jgi:hypothetical protein